MDHPHLLLVGEGVVEPSEKVGLTDPHDGGEDMCPAGGRTQPVVNNVAHRSPRFALRRECSRIAAMRAIERILDQLNRAWGGPSWTGVEIRPLLDDLTDAQARAHPVPNAHSIIELVAHMSVWMDVVAHRLTGPKELTTE